MKNEKEQDKVIKWVFASRPLGVYGDVNEFERFLDGNIIRRSANFLLEESSRWRWKWNPHKSPLEARRQLNPMISLLLNVHRMESIIALTFMSDENVFGWKKQHFMSIYRWKTFYRQSETVVNGIDFPLALASGASWV